MEVGTMENFVYLVACSRTREAAIIDPAWEVTEILKQAAEQQWRVTHALVTHHHHDHTNGIPALVAATDATVVMQAAEVPMMRCPVPNLRAVGPGEDVLIGDIAVRCVHTPGHTPGSQCFHVRDTLLSGDTLFVNACGRCDFPGGDAVAMYDSLHRVLGALPGDTRLYPGHNYAEPPVSTLEQERHENPYYKTEGLQEFLELRMGPSRIRLSGD
jgi:glyoxylase-like metal-dependent hydrolase (beta-lactamase superfamily II)